MNIRYNTFRIHMYMEELPYQTSFKSLRCGDLAINNKKLIYKVQIHPKQLIRKRLRSVFRI
jgi:hypothetical protein